MGFILIPAGVGSLCEGVTLGPEQIQEGDAVLISSDLGRHGIAVMGEREGLQFETRIESDGASLWPLVKAMLQAKVPLHGLRDLTRGGLATALVELSKKARKTIWIDEAQVPIEESVRGACEILGLDPLYIANEGCLVAFVPERSASKALEIMRHQACGSRAVSIGQVKASSEGRVLLRNSLGTSRLLSALTGEQLPRIC